MSMLVAIIVTRSVAAVLNIRGLGLPMLASRRKSIRAFHTMASQASATVADDGSTRLKFASDGLTVSQLDKVRLLKNGLDIQIQITAPLLVTL
ncbi:hypothetical protein AC579_2328 [Pseudocercospora musae]|uniref:Uncharacterized protein n=1 Tax=Pseudocercospora musae TaxID=113226 RepID=A0A139H3P8_9PEZI|nr:hypothetical protein AC579_2328 [Pseudocercospora musae]